MNENVYKVKYVPQSGGYIVVADRPDVSIFRGDQPACEDFAWCMNFARYARNNPKFNEAVDQTEGVADEVHQPG